MSATKILWGQIIAVFLIVLIAIWGATQWTASALAYQPELGPPWFMAGDWPIYPPPAFFWWWFSFDAYAPDIFQTGAYIAVSGGLVSIAVAIGMSVWRARELKNAETYGSARWASEKEIRRAGLLGNDGVVLGQFERTYLRHDGPEHVLCYNNAILDNCHIRVSFATNDERTGERVSKALGKRPDSEAYGWYIVCNDRVVVTADKSADTVWGHKPVPTWHPQFTGFMGIARFSSDDPWKLPWKTTKRDVEKSNEYDKAIYKQRNVIERMFCRLKDWRCIATRFDRNVKNFMSAIALAPAVIWWL